MTRYLILFLGLIISFGLINLKSNDEKKQIDITAITSVEILKESGPPDTIRHLWKKLTPEQVKSFVDKWNRSPDKELRKYLPAFKVAVHLKNDSTRQFRANGQFIKENSDWCVDFKDHNYFEKLYSAATLKGNR